MKCLLSPNPYRDRGLRATQNAEKILNSCGAETVICLPFSVDSDFELPDVKLGKLEDEIKSSDIIISFGGDGTILHASKDALPYHLPILGINLGSVGFMAELETSELASLRKLCAGNFWLEERVMLNVRVERDRKIIYEDVALNDAVITKGAVARMVDLQVYADEHMATAFTGDGLIVSTPTGSTAYSMAAGGPIVEPTASNIIITPICAQSLHTKSFVLSPQRRVRTKISGRSRRNAFLSVDGGKALKLCYGDEISVTISEHKTKLIRLTNRSFYEIINTKLGQL